MNEFLIGLIATIIGSILTYIFRENIENLIFMVFRKIFPSIKGEWRAYSYYTNSDSILDLDEDTLIKHLVNEGASEKEIEDKLIKKEILEQEKLPKTFGNEELVEQLKTDNFFIACSLKQIANKLNGYITVHENSIIQRTIKFTGKVTASRVVLLSTEDITQGCHNYGTYLMKLSSDGKYMKGYETFLCTNCEETTYSNVIMEKIK